MKISYNISPLQNENKFRGAGFYVSRLKDALIKYFPENEYTFFKAIEDIKYDQDIIHYPFFDPFFLTLPVQKRFPLIITVHDLIPILFPDHFPAGIKGKLKWSIQKFLLSKCDAIITDSHSSADDIVKLTGIPKKNVHVVYLAADEKYKELKDIDGKKLEIKKKYNLPENYALYVGDVTWNKNLLNLLLSVQKLNIPLIMVGKSLVKTDFDYKNSWNKPLIQVNKIANDNNNIIRLGFIPQEDLIIIYNCADVFVMPSFYEGFGLPILEAMQSGCPVVTSKGGSLGEVAGEAAYYVDPNDVESISKGIEKVYNDRTLQNVLKTEGLKQAKKFSWKNAAEETIKIYETVNKFKINKI